MISRHRVNGKQQVATGAWWYTDNALLMPPLMFLPAREVTGKQEVMIREKGRRGREGSRLLGSLSVLWQTSIFSLHRTLPIAPSPFLM